MNIPELSQITNTFSTKKNLIKKETSGLYSFNDLSLFAAEEKDYLHRVNKNNKFSAEKYEEKRKEFGTIVLETDLGLSPEIAFNSYNSRWLLMPISA